MRAACSAAVDSSSAWKICVVDVARHEVREELVGRLIEDVIDVRGAELLGFGVDRALVGRVDADAFGFGGLDGGVALLFGHLFGGLDLVLTELADRQQLFDDDALLR